MLPVRFDPPAAKYIKKLKDKKLKKLYQEAIDKIREDYTIGETKTGDLIGFYGYGVPIPLKEDRINMALSYIAQLPKGQKDVMEIVMDVYRTTDWTDLRLIKIFSLPAFASKGYTVKTALKPFGGKDGYEKVIDEMEETLL